MNFSIGINFERRDPGEDMRAVEENALEFVLMAEDAGFEKLWVPEHHGIEMIIAPNPFVIIAGWAARTTRIRLGTATIARHSSRRQAPEPSPAPPVTDPSSLSIPFY